MSEQPKKFYLTTPIYYVNARPHIGHAYTTIVADVLARRHRLLGEDTFFLTGTDEHGQKIERSAAAAGIPPKQFTDQVAHEFQHLWDRMGITYNKFIRTTSTEHARGVQKLFAELYSKGFIYLDSYTGAYCVSDETFVDAPAGTPCPDCGRLLETVTEENFFFKLSAFQKPLLDLIESGQLKIENEGRRNEVLSFLRGNLGAILELINEDLGAPVGQDLDAVEAFRYAVKKGFLKQTEAKAHYVPGALKDLSVSRSSFTWGIPVPEPAASAAKDKHVIYVWLDALANYMTAIGYGSDAPADEDEFKKFWPADLHLVGKEIIRFHCVYWPAFLLAAGLPLPKAITAHGWLLFDNSKMSKSKGNIVRTETILDAFGTLCPPSFTGGSSGLQPTESKPIEKGALAPEPEPTYRRGTASAVPKDPTGPAASAAEVRPATQKERDLFASDVLRYFLLREIPFGQDGSFSFDALITRYNADLANGYGNLVSRVLRMVNDFFGSIPQPHAELLYPMNSEEAQSACSVYKVNTSYVRGAVVIAAHTFNTRFEEIDLFAVAEAFKTIISIVDAYITIREPWKQYKLGNVQDCKDTLYVAAEVLRWITALSYPILPYATTRVWQQLGLDPAELTTYNSQLTTLQWGGLKPGTKLGPLSPIFPRADKSLIETMIQMENPELSSTTSNLSSRPEAASSAAAVERPADGAAPKSSHDAPLKSATTPAHFSPTPTSSFDPAAPPRAFTEPDAATQVGGSHAQTTHTGPTPSHKEAPASGPFATVAAQTPITAQATDAAPQITIDDFAKIELRVAQVLVAERIPKADKLLRLEVDLGAFGGGARRQILSGIAEWYAPEDLIGRRIIVITNLAPRKMRGLESHGMLLAASEEGGKPFLATVPEGVPVGTRLK
jgi:methionyl-tRNA synthetase